MGSRQSGQTSRTRPDAGSAFRGTQATLPQPVPFLSSPEFEWGSSAPWVLDENRLDAGARLPDHTHVRCSFCPREPDRSHTSPLDIMSSVSLNNPTGCGEWDRGALFPQLDQAPFIRD